MINTWTCTCICCMTFGFHHVWIFITWSIIITLSCDSTRSEIWLVESHVTVEITKAITVLFQDAENAIKTMHGKCMVVYTVQEGMVMNLISTFQARCSVAGPSEPTGPPERDHKVSQSPSICTPSLSFTLQYSGWGYNWGLANCDPLAPHRADLIHLSICCLQA